MRNITEIILDPYDAPWYADTDLTPLEILENKEAHCMKSGTKYSDDHGHDAIEMFCCGIITDLTCLPHRIKNISSKFSWMNDNEFVFKPFFNIQYTSSEDIRKNYALLHDYATTIREDYPRMWFRLLMTNTHIVLLVKREDKYVIPNEEMDFGEVMKEYVDFTAITDKAMKETLLIENKNKRRILGAGKAPQKSPIACNRTPEIKNRKYDDPTPRFSLKRTNGKVLHESEFEGRPASEYVPIDRLVYAIGDAGEEYKVLDFKMFLHERIAGNYLEEWEEHHGGFESKRIIKYLTYLLSNDEKTWGFLKDELKRITDEKAAIKTAKKEERDKKKAENKAQKELLTQKKKEERKRLKLENKK